MQESLTILFGGQSRVRLLRLFLLNPSAVFSIDTLIRRTRLSRRTVRTELSVLERAKVVRKKQTEELVAGKRRRVHGYALNTPHSVVRPLRQFFLETAPLESGTLLRHLRGAGRPDVLVAAGVFKKEFDRRLDVLIASPKPNMTKIDAAMRALEIELGVEIKYTAISTEELFYRLSMYDKLVRDIFDYPHDLLVDRVELAGVVYR